MVGFGCLSIKRGINAMLLCRESLLINVCVLKWLPKVGKLVFPSLTAMS